MNNNPVLIAKHWKKQKKDRKLLFDDGMYRFLEMTFSFNLDKSHSIELTEKDFSRRIIELKDIIDEDSFEEILGTGGI